MHHARRARTGSFGPVEQIIKRYTNEICKDDYCNRPATAGEKCASHNTTELRDKRKKDNPELVAEEARKHASRRRARENDAFVDDINRDVLIEMWGGFCYLCMNPLPENSVEKTVEHITPLSRGGLHSWENVAPADRACNSRKGTMTFTEYVYKNWRIHILWLGKSALIARK